MHRTRPPNPIASYWLSRRPRCSPVQSSTTNPNTTPRATTKPHCEPSPFTRFDDSARYKNVTFVKIVPQLAYGGMGRNGAGEPYFLLRVGRGSSAVLRAVPAARLAARNRAFFEWLANAGVPVLRSESKTKFFAALEDFARDKSSFSVMAKPGWAAGLESFVHPSGLIGPARPVVVFGPSDKHAEHYEKFRVRGSARQWRDGAGALHCGNSLGITLAAAALASPLLLPLAEGNFAVCVVGAPGSGKSSWLAAASSQWGAHTEADMAKRLGTAAVANHTVNSLEEQFTVHNDLGLVVDDFRSLRGAESPVDVIEQLAFALSDGAERGRQTSVRAPDRFRLVLLASANQSIQAKAAASRRTVDRAVLDRLIEIPLPFEHSAVEELHGGRSLGEFCDRLKSRSVQCAGAIGLLFVRKLHAWLAMDRDDCVTYLERKQQVFMNKNANSGANDRVLRRFGLIYAAGCLAIKFGLHPWNRDELAHAVATSLTGHVRLTISQAPGTPAAAQAEIEKLLAFLRDWFVKQRPHMRDLSTDPVVEGSAIADTAPAYLFEHHKHGQEVLLKDAHFTRLIWSVCNPAEAKRLLVSAGVISGDAARTSVKRTIGRKRDGKLSRKYVIALKCSAINPARMRKARSTI